MLGIWNPYGVGQGLAPSQFIDLAAKLAGARRARAVEMLYTVPDVPAYVPQGDDPGGPNNYDHVVRAVVAFLVLWALGEKDKALRWLNYLERWLVSYRDDEKRDMAHLYLGGPALLIELLPNHKALCELAHAVIRRYHDDLAYNLNRYRTTGAPEGFYNIRLVSRTLSNAITMLMSGYGMDRIALRTALRWWLALESAASWNLPKEMRPAALVTKDPKLVQREFPGWGVDKEGAPFQIDENGNRSSWWDVRPGGLYIPYQIHSIEAAMLYEVQAAAAISLDGANSIEVQSRVRFDQLLEWFWKRCYNPNPDDDLHRGTGATHLLEVLDPTGEHTVPPASATGEMLYPFWLYVRREAVRCSDASVLRGWWQTARGMMRAQIAQIDAHWKGHGPQMMYSPELWSMIAVFVTKATAFGIGLEDEQ